MADDKLLEQQQLSAALKGTNLYLIGMMGTGKTTIAQILAKQLNYRFFDTDAVVEQAAKQSVVEIFASSGEQVFRELETQVLSQLAAYRNLVVATGGGIVTQRQNWSYLHHGVVVWLDVSVERLLDRLQQDATRPLLQAPDPEQRLRELLEQRQPLYAQADIRITYDRETPEQAAAIVLEEVQRAIQNRHADSN